MTRSVIVSSLCKSFGRGSRAVQALSSVDFEAAPGQVSVLLGLNGAGKSTLLKCIAGVLLPSSGEVSVCGESEQGRIRALVGFVGESGRAAAGLAVAEALAEDVDFRHGNDKELVREAVALTGLEKELGKKCRALSKGYKQRLALAQALCQGSPVLLLDEFSDGLDPAQQLVMRTAIRDISAEKTVIVSTHSISEAVELGGRIYIMRDGTVAMSGSAKEIVERTGKGNLEKAFLSLTKGEK